MARQALVVRGGWTGHTPMESSEVFIPLLRAEGFEVRVADTLDAYLDPDLPKNSLIFQVWTMGQITKEQEEGLRHAVRAGTGLAGFHGGLIDSFRHSPNYQLMTGGQWVCHPGNCIRRYQVNITDREHPITRGLKDFELTDTEQYYCLVDPGNEVLCRTTFVEENVQDNYKGIYKLGTVMPYAWTRPYGKGRVFVAAWGHTFKDFDVPEAKEIVRRGMFWAARG